MRTRNAMQLKARINDAAKSANIPPQALMQNYLFERFLERLSKSSWRSKIVIKGGMLISSLVGVASRTTMDLDTTICGFNLTHDSAESIFCEIASISCGDDWRFEFDRTENIRETDDYPGIRVHLKAIYPPMTVPLTIDVTTGDKITPGPIHYEYPLLFDEGSISLMAYPLETVLAEKLETVISRGITNARPRDYYDIQMLWQLHSKECSIATLRSALGATCEKRGSRGRMTHWKQALDEVAADRPMYEQWDKYTKKEPICLRNYPAGLLPNCSRNSFAAMTTIQRSL